MKINHSMDDGLVATPEPRARGLAGIDLRPAGVLPLRLGRDLTPAYSQNVTLVPLDAWVKKLRAGEWVLEGSQDGQSKATVLTRDDAFVPDKLHPSTLGALALGQQLIAFLRDHKGITKAELELDLWGSYRKLLASRTPSAK